MSDVEIKGTKAKQAKGKKTQVSDEEEDDEEEMHLDDEQEIEDDDEEEVEDDDAYGQEDEDEEEDNVFSKATKKGGKNNKDSGKKKSASIYADYEEFASILEQDVYNEEKAKKYLGAKVGQKRGRAPQRGGFSKGKKTFGKGGAPKRQRTK